MKIAIINENSQASKNKIIYDALKTIADKIGYAKGFGWGSELTLTYIFEKLFETEFGGGYPKERVVPEQANKKILDKVKKATYKDMLTILKEIDQEFLLQTINREQFKKYFFENAEEGEIKEYIKKILK